MHVYISMHACMMYLFLLEMEGGSDWLKAGNKHEEGELTSLASDHIRWDRYGMYRSWYV